MAKTRKAWLQEFRNELEKGQAAFFGGLGKLVAARPWITIVLCVLLTGLLGGLGVLRFAVEDDPFELYVPSSARATYDHEKMVEKKFGPLPVQIKLLVYPKEKFSSNLLDSPKESLGELMDMWEVLMGKEDGRPFSDLQAICVKPRKGFPCIRSSILSLWDFNRTKLNNDPDILKTLNSEVVKDGYGRETPISENLGGIIRSPGGHSLSHATAFYTYFALGHKADRIETMQFLTWLGPKYENYTADQLKDVAQKEGFLANPYLLDDKIAKIMENWGKRASTKLEASMTHLNRVRIESEQAIAKDLRWTVLAIALVLFASIIVLWRNNRVYCKSHLAIMSIIAIIMALLAGFGFALAIGVKFNLVVAAVPFLIVGLGIDDTFIIMGQYRRVDPTLSPSDRVSSALSKAGPSIFLTSLTDLIAFIIGLASSIPALQAFCVYASFGVLFDFLFQVTFFVAFVAFEARREQKYLNELGMPVATDNDINKHPQPSPRTIRMIGRGSFDSSKPSISSKMFGHLLPSFLFNWKGMTTVLIIEAMLLTGGIYGCTKASVDFQYREWFTPKNSWIRDGFELEYKYFSGNQAVILLYTIGGSHFYNQEKMLNCISEIEDSPHMAPTPRLNSWFKDYVDWSRRLHSNRLNDKGWAVDSETFAGLVSEFLDSSEGEVYYKDVQFNKQKTQITSTELIKGFSKSIESAHDGISMMTDLRKRATDAAPELSPVVISDLFPIYEGLRVLKKDTIVNLAAVGAVVLFIISVMLMNVQAAFLVSLMLAFTDVLLIGYMYFVGLTFNIVTSICIVLAVGIAVDYSLHVAHNFMIQTGTRKERACAALEAIGGEVLCGAATSWLAIKGLVLTQTYTMQIFYKMLSALIALGAWHGIIVLPVLLVLLGPAPYVNQE